MRPVRRLHGFQRVSLKAGASQDVSLTLTTDDVGFYDNNADFQVEPGTIEVYVGNSSEATLMSTFTVS